jgi:hypothetical protein
MPSIMWCVLRNLGLQDWLVNENKSWNSLIKRRSVSMWGGASSGPALNTPRIIRNNVQHRATSPSSGSFSQCLPNHREIIGKSFNTTLEKLARASFLTWLFASRSCRTEPYFDGRWRSPVKVCRCVNEEPRHAIIWITAALRALATPS